jgi:sugar/nucleoside kinase (ribokinase family)
MNSNNIAKGNTLILGGTTYDHIISLPEFPKPIPQTIHQTSFFEMIGSTGTGKALCLTKLEIPSILYSVLGDDIFGHQIVEFLKKENVDFIYDMDPKGTERHINIIDAQGNRISMFVTQSSEFPDINRILIEEYIRKSEIIILNIISYCKELIPVLKRYNKPVWTDLHDYTDGNLYHQPFIEISDYIFLSSDNLSDYIQTMKDLINTGEELVVCTHGKNSAAALSKSGEWIDEPALSGFTVMDTNVPEIISFQDFFMLIYKASRLMYA